MKLFEFGKLKKKILKKINFNNIIIFNHETKNKFYCKISLFPNAFFLN